MAAFSVTQEVAESIRDAALSVDGVAGVSGGRMGQAFLRVSGAMIEGIQLIDDTVPHRMLPHLHTLLVRRRFIATRISLRNRRILVFVATFPRFRSILVVRPCVLLGCRSPGSFAVDC